MNEKLNNEQLRIRVKSNHEKFCAIEILDNRIEKKKTSWRAESIALFRINIE